MPNQYVNKVVQSDGTTLIDISDTTAVASDVAQGKYFYLATGEKVSGTGSGGGTGAISVVDTTDSHGGTVRTITALDISDSTLTTADQLAQGITGYNKLGVKLTGTGGGTPSATAHTIYFEFSDSTDTTITAYWNDSFISSAITATTPTTYGQKTVTLAQLDGVTWYNPAGIPLNTQLIDYTKCLSDTAIDTSGQEISQQWYYATDYTEIDPSMTFSYKASIWHSICFYTASKTFISYLDIQHDATPDQTYSNVGVGTLTPSKIPSNAKYIRTTSIALDSAVLSLIRTA